MVHLTDQSLRKSTTSLAAGQGVGPIKDMPAVDIFTDQRTVPCCCWMGKGCSCPDRLSAHSGELTLGKIIAQC